MSSLHQCPNCQKFNCFHKPTYHRSAWKLPSRKSSFFEYFNFIVQFFILDLFLSWGLWICIMYFLMWFSLFFLNCFGAFLSSHIDVNSKSLETIYRSFQKHANVSPASMYYYGLSILYGLFGIFFLIILYHAMSFILLFDRKNDLIPKKYLFFFNRIYGGLSYALLKKSSIVKKTKVLTCKECGITLPSEQIHNFTYLLNDEINKIWSPHTIQEEVKKVNQLILKNDFIVDGGLLDEVWKKHDEVSAIAEKDTKIGSVNSASRYIWNDGLLNGLINKCFRCSNNEEKIYEAKSLIRFFRNNQYYKINKMCTTVWSDKDSNENQ